MPYVRHAARELEQCICGHCRRGLPCAVSYPRRLRKETFVSGQARISVCSVCDSAACQPVVYAEPSDSIRILLFFIAAFIFTYVIAADISDEKRLVKLLAFIYAAVILTSLYAIIQRKFGLVYVSASFTDLKLNTGIPSRVTSTLDNPNNFSEFLVLFMPLCAAFAGTRKKQLSCVVLLIGLALPAVALIMTYSRSGWISLMLAAFVYIWLRNKKAHSAFLSRWRCSQYRCCHRR